MKKVILLIVLSVCCTVAVRAQNSYSPQRYIYLWDVTYSMCGYVGTDDRGKEIIDPEKDIFDEVVDLLKRQIGSKVDPNTIIMVCPFRGKEGLLDTFTGKATKDGISLINKEIDNFAAKIKAERKRTNTDVISAIRQAKSRYIKPDADNFLVILTDGVQNERLSDGRQTTIKDLCEEIEEWEDLDDEDIFAYLYYYMLTVSATDDDLQETLEETKNVAGVYPGEAFKPSFTLQPAKKVSVNIKDNKTAILTFKINERDPLPEGVRVSVSAEDDAEDILDIDDEEFTLENNQIEIPLRFRRPYKELKNMLPEKSTVTFEIELVDADRADAIIRLASDDFKLELINKPEKTLTITIKR